MTTAITGFLTLCFFVVPFLAYLYSGYHRFCNNTQYPSAFCSSWPPNIYSYVEDKFWEVGFLKYYSTGQPFQVAFGLMTVAVAMTVLLVALKSRKLKLNDLYSTGLVASLAIVAIITTFFANVQSGTRFFSTHPLFYVTCGWCCLRPFRTRKFSFFQKLLLGYFVLFNVAGCLWFPLRFNWA